VEIVGMLKKEEENLSNWKNQIERGVSAQDAQGLERLKDEVDKYTLCDVSFSFVGCATKTSLERYWKFRLSS
jgi:hypothetical protein